MRSAKSFPIDPAALRHALNMRDLKTTIISVEMGHAKTYMNTLIKWGRCTVATAVTLDALYGIKREEYELVEIKQDEPKVEAVPTDTQACAIDYVQLYNTVYAAMLAALRQNAKDLKDRMFAGKEAS